MTSCWVDIRLVVLSRLAMCHFGLVVVISNFWKLVVLMRIGFSEYVLQWCLPHKILYL